MMAAQHPVFPKPLQPRPSTFPQPDPSNNLETPPPPLRVPASTPWPGPVTGNALQTLGFIPEMIKNPCWTSCQGLAPATNVTFVEHKSLGSWDVFLSLFFSLAEGGRPDIIFLQDPPFSKAFLPSFSGFESFAPPVARPRVAC